MNTPIPKNKIAYIEGAGDKVDESLQQIGLNITTITPESITLEEIKSMTYWLLVFGHTIPQNHFRKNNLF